MSKITGMRGLYAITDTVLCAARGLLPSVAAAIRGGAVMIQYRDKSDDSARRLQEASALAKLCHEQDVLLIINDDIALARACGADGVHLGAEDTGLRHARGQLGQSAIIGISCYDSLELARKARKAGADYVAFGSFFDSPTKPTARSASLSLLGEARDTLDVPAVAIGGITPKNGGLLVQAGASLLAVVSGVFGESDPEAAARRYTALFDA